MFSIHLLYIQEKYVAYTRTALHEEYFTSYWASKNYTYTYLMDHQGCVTHA